MDFGEVVKVTAQADAPEVLVLCEHASNRIPSDLHRLGISEEVARSHVAWDPGALGVAEAFAGHFASVLVAGGVSRLVYDCNRPPEAPSAIIESSEAHDIPGNRGLSAAERAARVDAIYVPFTSAVERQLDRYETSLHLMVTVHSFTRIYNGVTRAVEIGVLHGQDDRFARAMLINPPGNRGYDVRLNEPYSARDGVTHSLDRYGSRNGGLANVMIEIRSDLIATDDAQTAMAEYLAEWVKATLKGFPLGESAQ